MKHIISSLVIVRVACMVAGLATVFSANASKIYFVHNDHLGTPQVITDENKNVRWEVDKDPWGNVTHVISNSLPNNVSLPGQHNDLETGYADNWWRPYDSKTGQYLQSDPIGLSGGVNTYGYALQNPVMNTDELGLMATFCEMLKNLIDAKLPSDSDWVFANKIIGDFPHGMPRHPTDGKGGPSGSGESNVILPNGLIADFAYVETTWAGSQYSKYISWSLNTIYGSFAPIDADYRLKSVGNHPAGSFDNAMENNRGTALGLLMSAYSSLENAYQGLCDGCINK